MYSFIQIGTFFEYVMDIEAYTEKYCVNIDVPDTSCNGKCHLTEELAKNEEQHQSPEIQQAPEILLFTGNHFIELEEFSPFYENRRNYFQYQEGNIESPISGFFQPPRA